MALPTGVAWVTSRFILPVDKRRFGATHPLSVTKTSKNDRRDGTRVCFAYALIKILVVGTAWR
jgi:hypothetical protein